MSYQNFKPDYWSKYIQGELGKLCVLHEDCDYTFEGEVKYGERVKILGVGRPSIGDYTGEDIGDPEKVADSSVYLDIDQAKYFNFMVDDVDKAQGKPGLMEKLTEESAAGLAEARDTFIGTLASDAGELSDSAAITTADGAKAAVDTAFEYLWDNGVKVNMPTTIIITTWFYNLFKEKLTELYTDNVKMIAQGIIGTYNGAPVKLSNNLYNDGTDDYMMIKTKKAIAFAGQIEKTEAYRPHNLFADALKGLDVYGAKVVRPKELYVIRGRKA
jgi:hypothetical protein